jgi:hypothetical protein
MVAFGFCHYSDGTPVIGWEAIRPHINKLTKEQARRKIWREEALKLWHKANELADRIVAGEDGISWEDVNMIQAEAIELENKALGR